jgi:hypothetical protein
MNDHGLTRLDPQLAYLVQLTRYGLKPLSRWEGRLGDRERDVIASTGLELDTITRRTRIGRKVHQTVFARSRRATDFYRGRFEGTPLRHTPEEIRLEGQLFGYPSCCVDAFIRRPYTPNRLDREDQEILFHWACPDCVVTPGLLRDYRRVHTECTRWFRGKKPARDHPLLTRRSRLIPVAASFALAAGGAAFGSDVPNPHWLPAPDDADSDYLSVAEEILRGTIWDNPDTDGDGRPDGVQAADTVCAMIQNPPPGIEVVPHLIGDFEPCLVCGMPVDMGFVEIIDHSRGLADSLHFIALHYLCEGCLEYRGGLHQGRVEYDPLKRIFLPCDPPHLLPPDGVDPDGDGLLSEEEPPLETDPSDPDTDDDTLADGPQVAEGLLPILASLPRTPDGNEATPYMIEAWADGLENCEVCGVTLNMGHVEIVNPAEGLSLNVPFVGVHTLAHGGNVYNGTYNEGRVLPVLLRTVLTGNGTAHWLTVPGDGDGDGLTNAEELQLGRDPANPDEDGDLIPDGRELAVQMAGEIRALPEGPLPDRVYVIHHLAFGHYNCLTCGELANMGFVEIVNPINETTVNVPYYNLHFMDRGSYSTDRDDLYPRVDPVQIARVLWGLVPVGAPDPAAVPWTGLWNAPNPFSNGERTGIVLNLPGYEGEIDVAVFDAGGRRVRELFVGRNGTGAMRLSWDGRDSGGRDLAPGTYFCRVKIGSLVLSRKLTLAG